MSAALVNVGRRISLRLPPAPARRQPRFLPGRHSSAISAGSSQKAATSFAVAVASVAFDLRAMMSSGRRMLVALSLAVAPAGGFAPRGARLLHSSAARRRHFRSTPVVSMALKTGIVGLPNVGKSTLFNALMQESQAQAANFPFCTIEPNVGVVAVPDKKLEVLGEISNSAKLVPTSLSFVDIAGLVEGASKGEGLGNQFLSNIRECDAIVHVVRCFDDPNIVHVSGSVDPLRDVEVISLELVLADLAQVERRAAKVAKDTKAGTSSPEEVSALAALTEALDGGKPARLVELSPEEEAAVKGLGLLSAKKVIYAANVLDADLAEGNPMVEKVREHAKAEGSSCVIVSAQV